MPVPTQRRIFGSRQFFTRPRASHDRDHRLDGVGAGERPGQCGRRTPRRRTVNMSSSPRAGSPPPRGALLELGGDAFGDLAGPSGSRCR